MPIYLFIYMFLIFYIKSLLCTMVHIHRKINTNNLTDGNAPIGKKNVLVENVGNLKKK